MGVPQIIIIALLAMGLGASIVKNGEPRGNYSAGYTFVMTSIWAFVLWWGGFYGH